MEFIEKIKNLIYTKDESNIELAIELAKGLGEDIRPSKCAIDKYKNDYWGDSEPSTIDTILYLLDRDRLDSYSADMALKNKLYLDENVISLTIFHPYNVSLFKSWENIIELHFYNNSISADLIEMINVRYLYIVNCCSENINSIQYNKMCNLENLKLIDIPDLGSMDFTSLNNLKEIYISVEEFNHLHKSITKLRSLENLKIRSDNQIPESTLQEIKKKLSFNCEFFVGGRLGTFDNTFNKPLRIV